MQGFFIIIIIIFSFIYNIIFCNDNRLETEDILDEQQKLSNERFINELNNDIMHYNHDMGTI